MVAVLLTVLPAVMVWHLDVKSMAVDAFDASSDLIATVRRAYQAS